MTRGMTAGMIEPPQEIRPQDDFTRSQSMWQRLGLMMAIASFAGIIVLPEPSGLSSSAHLLAAVTVLMAVLWVSQAIPIPATALIPLAAYPLLGIQSAGDVSQSYINANIFLFFGGFIVALGIERWGLHRRMALHVVRLIGGNLRWLVLGFMVATAALSMWISNTATTMLMLPIALALLSTLKDVSSSADDDEATRAQTERTLARLGVGLMLGIAYSASCGGLATLVGTPTNIAFMGQWRELFPEAPQPSMAEWMVVFLPLTAVMLAATFIVVTWRLPGRIGSTAIGRGFFTQRLHALGRPSVGEWAMLAVFIATATLWLTRQSVEFQIAGREEPVTLVKGWSSMYERVLIEQLGADEEVARGAMHDATVAMLMALVMFVIRVPTESRSWKPLIDWETVERGMPWGMLLLFGGGFAMASAFASTGLSAWLGETLAHSLQGVSLPILVAAICLLMTFLTEFTSNVATVSTLLPILAGAALTLDVDPRLLMIPATVTASCAFMLPIATPPNAIVFAGSRVSMGQMVKHGFLLNLIGVMLVTAITFVLLVPVMGVSTEGLPEWTVAHP